MQFQKFWSHYDSVFLSAKCTKRIIAILQIKTKKWSMVILDKLYVHHMSCLNKRIKKFLFLGTMDD